MLTCLKLVATTIIILTSVSSMPAFAQPNTAPCSCNGVLINGVFSERASKGEEEARKEVLSYVQNSTYEQMRRDYAANAGGSYAGYGITAGMSEAAFNTRKAELIRIENL